MSSKKVYTPKQEELLSLFKHNKLKRINILQGSVRSGKTWISLVLWAFWVATMPVEHQYIMCAKSLPTLKRNCLVLLQTLVGKKNFKYSLSKKEGVLFGRVILFEGANDARSEDKIRGLTLAGAYCDELTLFPEDFFAMLLSRLSVKNAKLFGTTNTDIPKHWLKINYLDRENEIDLLQLFFSIDDNTFLDPEYIEKIKKENVGVFYLRFILGLWVVASGAVYRIFADETKKYEIYQPDLPIFKYINIGVDFGGNKSAHAFVATAISADNKLVTLKSERHKAADVTPDELNRLVYAFCENIQKKYGKIKALYADSAEQTLINGMRIALRPLGIIVKNSIKKPITDRIHATTSLMSQERFKYIKAECESLENALCGAVYDDKSMKDARLDNGTSDIDTLDAFEYSFEPYIYQLIRGA